MYQICRLKPVSRSSTPAVKVKSHSTYLYRCLLTFLFSEPKPTIEQSPSCSTPHEPPGEMKRPRSSASAAKPKSEDKANSVPHKARSVSRQKGTPATASRGLRRPKTTVDASSLVTASTSATGVTRPARKDGLGPSSTLKSQKRTQQPHSRVKSTARQQTIIGELHKYTADPSTVKAVSSLSELCLEFKLMTTWCITGSCTT